MFQFGHIEVFTLSVESYCKVHLPKLLQNRDSLFYGEFEFLFIAIYACKISCKDFRVHLLHFKFSSLSISLFIAFYMHTMPNFSTAIGKVV